MLQNRPGDADGRESRISPPPECVDHTVLTVSNNEGKVTDSVQFPVMNERGEETQGCTKLSTPTDPGYQALRRRRLECSGHNL